MCFVSFDEDIFHCCACGGFGIIKTASAQQLFIIEICSCDVMDNVGMEQLHLSAKVKKYIFVWPLILASGH